jgi:alkanesulfonate monooxygenase SsuD/methylene tetrahydromethanopterin reductase-like flavin-dependent oxidoreductase (luciferase family)
MAMLAEQLEIVHRAWGPEAFSFSGEHYSIDDLDAMPKPGAAPHPPLLMGGIAGPRGAALAARWADEYNTVFATVDECVARRDAIAAACSDAGREPIPFSLMTGCVVGRTRSELAGRVEALLARRDDLGVDSVDAFLADPPSGWIVGTIDDAVAQLGAYRDAGLSRVMLQNLLHEDLDVLSLIGRELAPAVA